LRDDERDDEDEEVEADVAALDASFKEGVHHAQEEVRQHTPRPFVCGPAVRSLARLKTHAEFT
jgi:hypothetical protein